MTAQSFKDLIVWQRASDLAFEIYTAFGSIKDFGFRDQIQRAAVSVMNNIAEGCARRSDKTFYHFLCISKGSVAEVESMLILALRLEYLSEAQQAQLLARVDEVSRLLNGFMKKLSAQDS